MQAVLDSWRRLNPKEGRRLAGTSVVADLEGVLGSEPVIWFQRVEWWPAAVSVPTAPAVPADPTDPADPDGDIFGGSILGFSTADEPPSGPPDAGVVAVTATRLLLIGERTRASWPLSAVTRSSFHPARFVQSTAAHIELRTPDGLHRLLPGRGVSAEKLLSEVADARTRIRAVPTVPAVAANGATAALLGQLAEMRDRGTITQAQFEAERSRLLN